MRTEVLQLQRGLNEWIELCIAYLLTSRPFLAFYVKVERFLETKFSTQFQIKRKNSEYNGRFKEKTPPIDDGKDGFTLSETKRLARGSIQVFTSPFSERYKMRSLFGREAVFLENAA